MLKRIIALALAVSMISLPAYAQEETQSWVLVESSTGQTVKGQNENKKIPVGSLNKIMTLLLAAEAVDGRALKLSDEIKAPSKVNEAGGATIWLLPGDKMTAEELFKGLIIGSANDCAVTLAYKIGGSEEKFVDLMNKRAAALGMNNTLFKRCVTTDDGYSTAYDIAIASAELLKHEWLIPYMTTWMSDVRNGETMLVNNNELVRKYNGIQGVLAGASEKAGFCISTAAARDNKSYIAVACGYGDKEDAFETVKSLLNSGFEDYNLFSPGVKEDDLLPVQVKNGTAPEVAIELDGSQSVIIPSGQEENVKYNIELEEYLTAPVENGEKAGKLVMSLSGEKIYECNIITCGCVPEMTIWISFGRYLKSMFSL